MPLPTHRTFALALVLGTSALSSIAHAQQAPAPTPPAAAAPAAAAPAAPGAAPAAGVAAPGAPAPDAAAQPAPAPAQTTTELDTRRPGAAWVPWRGTAFGWSNDVTTTAVGVGRDNIGSEGESYSMGFGLTLNYFVVDEREFRLRVTTSLGVDTELTDGGTVTQREPQFRDLPLTLAASGRALTLAASEDGMWAFGFIPNYTTIFGTSPASQGRGVYATLSPRLLTYLNFPVLGADSPHLQSIFSGISVRYDRAITRATTPTNPDLNIPRKDPSNITFLSDQLGGGRLGENSFRVGGFLFLQEQFGPVQLQIFGGPSWNMTFLNEFDTVPCVAIATGCVEVAADPSAPNYRVNAGFAAGVSVYPSAEWGVDLSYSNNTLQLGEDGKRRDIFYSPDASFSATLIVSIDGIYEGLVGPRRDRPVVIFGKNAPNPQAPRSPLPPALASTVL
jgi:hypothetical protein